MTKVERKIESYKKIMTKEQFDKFKTLCLSSIDTKAKNTSNRHSLDLALYQVEDLAKIFKVRREQHG